MNVNAGQPAPPKVSDSPVAIAARKVTYEAQTCPKCHKELNVTAIGVGALIECDCGNITPRAKQLTPLLDRIKDLATAFGVTFIMGILTGIAGNYAYAQLFPSTAEKGVTPTQNQPKEGTQ
ncbi:hypothetical protein [Sinorhizobium meliloti]|uniref:hypothetical protein n=1 Tax=Rhizobium meliloti TaxID=382 RepID=UPI000483E614|nr:hypothetical protein [Sinorhizobium meliloti]